MKRGWKEGRVENSARSFHSHTNLHSRYIHIEGISLFDGRGSISRISAEQNNRMNGNRGWWSCPEHGVSGNEIFDQRGSTFWKWKLWEREGGKGEKSISFFSLVLFEIELVDADASRLATCREFWCIYRVNIEIFPSCRRRSSLQSGDFNFPAIDRAKKGKSIDRASPPRRQFISNA